MVIEHSSERELLGRGSPFGGSAFILIQLIYEYVMSRYVNPFHVIVSRGEAPGSDDISQLFGLPPGVSEEQWPEVAKTKMHHILTLSTEGLELPFRERVAALSIFFGREKGSRERGATAPFALVKIAPKQLAEGRLSDYPVAYKPWWNDEYPLASEIRAGVAFGLEAQTTIPEPFIRDVLEANQVFFRSDYEDVIYDFRNEQSYVGGFPVWSQEDDTPRDAHDNQVHFVLMLNGFDKYFEHSPLGTYDSYLFLDDEGNPFWVGQR